MFKNLYQEAKTLLLTFSFSSKNSKITLFKLFRIICSVSVHGVTLESTWSSESTFYFRETCDSQAILKHVCVSCLPKICETYAFNCTLNASFFTSNADLHLEWNSQVRPTLLDLPELEYSFSNAVKIEQATSC